MAFIGLPSRLPMRSRHRLPSVCRNHTLYSQRRPQVTAQLIGVPEGSGKSIEPDQNELLLAELRYSEPEKLPILVQNSLSQLDEGFYNFLEDKINSSSDLEERDTLRTLRDAITDIMQQLFEAVAKEQAENKSEGDTKAFEVSSSGADVAEASYDELIDKLANAQDLKVAVSASYERVDMRMLERLAERIAAEDDSTGKLKKVRDAISAEMNERMQRATDSVKAVLSAGDPVAMRKTIDTLARKGQIDDAFILLVQANLEQAKQAGAEPAVRAVQMVLDHAGKVKEMGLDPEIKLIRALLRTEDSEARAEMLMEALKPRGSVTKVDGTQTAGVQVEGKSFVVALRRLIEEFGNVDEAFVMKLSKIGEESEAVARKLFDMEGKDVKDLQDEAFHKRSVSIWDLEKYEMEEEMQGRKADWEGRMGEIPKSFDPYGKMEV